MEPLNKIIKRIEDKGLLTSCAPISTNGSSTLSRLQGGEVVNPNDAALQKELVTAFWTKLQKPEILLPDSMYRVLAREVLSEAARREWTKEDLQGSIRYFIFNVQVFGNRIEVASFFSEYTPPKVYTYQETLELGNKNFEPVTIDGRVFFKRKQ